VTRLVAPVCRGGVDDVLVLIRSSTGPSADYSGGLLSQSSLTQRAVMGGPTAMHWSCAMFAASLSSTVGEATVGVSPVLAGNTIRKR
jgi:hypothetical protein